MLYKQEIGYTLRSLRGLIAATSLDATASMLFLDALPGWIVDHYPKEIEILQGALVGVPLGDDRHQAIARYYLARLLVEFEALAVRTS